MAADIGDLGLKTPRSRLEVNFLRLFNQTQQMASGKKPKDWTFTKKVEWLEKTIPDLEKSPCSPSAETLKKYKRQVGVLKSVVEVDKSSADVESMPSLVSKGGSSIVYDESVASSTKASPTYEGSDIGQQIHHRTTAGITTRLREQLLGTDQEEPELSSKQNIDGMEEKLVMDEKRRDHLLSDMLAMTKQWKEQSKTAGTIIKNDIETMGKSSSVADTNYERLKIESDKLSMFNQRACNCWIWFMLLLVCCAFISMVLFIKLFPKRYVT